jgi:hypothetical protein
LGAAQIHLCIVIPDRLDLVHFQDIIVTKGLDACVERKLHKSPNPEELSAIDRKLAFYLVKLPMVNLTSPAAVPCWWKIAVPVNTFSTTTAELRGVCTTFGTLMDWSCTSSSL